MLSGWLFFVVIVGAGEIPDRDLPLLGEVGFFIPQYLAGRKARYLRRALRKADS